MDWSGKAANNTYRWRRFRILN